MALKLGDAAAGQQCDHIVGFSLSEFPQHGGMDGLVRVSEGISEITQAFNFCPLCGQVLRAPGKSLLAFPGDQARLQLPG